MKKIKIYLDTSIINFLFADDAPEKQDITVNFFKNYVKPIVYDVFISPVVMDEIAKTSDTIQKEKLYSVIKEYQLKILDIEEHIPELKRLAQCYIDRNIIPVKKLEDALHIAICTMYECDVLLSWNYKHLANINKERRITSVNLDEGYTHLFRMCTPMEVEYEDS